MHPEAAAVRRRALALAMVCARGLIEIDRDRGTALAVWQDMLAWFRDHELAAELEPFEVVLIETPVGELEELAVWRATWVVEGLAMLAWALGDSEWPLHESKSDPYEVANAVGLFDEEIHDRIQTSALRDVVALEAARELYYALDCRLRSQRQGRSAPNFRNWISREWLEALELSVETILHSDDLLVRGRPITDLSKSELQECASIVFERHRATIWLVEQETTYWETIVGT